MNCVAKNSGRTASTVAFLYLTKQGAWEGLPKGWTQESLKKFWDSLTGDVKHKVTKCMKEMEGKIDDPGAFCSSARDKVEGKAWRKEAVSRPAAKGKPAFEALSDAWDLYADDFLSNIPVVLDEIEMGSQEWQDADPKLADLGRKTTKDLRRLSVQSKAWAYAFNMILEGRASIDTPRMIADIETTLEGIEAIEKNLLKLGTYKAKLPDLWKAEMAHPWDRGMKSIRETKGAFEKAVKLLKADL